jgi:hypothetical protein
VGVCVCVCVYVCTSAVRGGSVGICACVRGESVEVCGGVRGVCGVRVEVCGRMCVSVCGAGDVARERGVIDRLKLTMLRSGEGCLYVCWGDCW